MNNAMQIIMLILLTLVSLPLLYCVFLSLVYFILKEPGSAAESAPALAPRKVFDFPGAPLLRFAIIVPAHNESTNIIATLDNLASLDYPRALYDVFVVADNCTDDTAAVVKARGVRCMERADPLRRGKGYALHYAFERLLAEPYRCFVVIDADSRLSANFLRTMNSRQLSGQQIVQAYYGIANPDAGPLTYLFLIGNTIENKLFYGAKARLGLPVNLRGNGMCFSRQVLLNDAWEAYSVVEDIEFGLALIRKGWHIYFAEEARVTAKQPETLQQAYTQRVRWASGNAKISRTYALTLMAEGLQRGNVALLDAGLGLLALSKPLLLLASLALLGVTVIYNAAFPGNGHLYVGWALLLLAAQCIYFATAVIMEPLTSTRIKYLLLSPLLMLWFFMITVLGLIGYRRDLWLRTKRA